MKPVFSLTILIFLIGVNFGKADEKDLTGKWEGDSPRGGKYEMDITVKADGVITGSGRVRNTKLTSTVSGKVKGQEVIIEVYRPGQSEVDIKYICSWTEAKVLQCQVDQFKSTFTKLNLESI